MADLLKRLVACVHEHARDPRKVERYRAMIRDWARTLRYDAIAITSHSEIPLNEKYAVLAAMHDASEHCDFPIDPWADRSRVRGRASPEEWHEANSSMRYAHLKQCAAELFNDEQTIVTRLRLLDDVCKDMALETAEV